MSALVHLDRPNAAARGDRALAQPAPVRIVHLGLGAFHRAHQAWYTWRATDGAEWGIAAFTGRGPAAAETLTAQDGLFTLVERAPDEDRVEVVGSIVQAHDGARVDLLGELLARPEVAIVTLTVTEAGYRLRATGEPDLDDPAVAADVDRLAAAAADGAPLAQAAPVTALGRLVAGLEARRRAGGAPIAIVPCDNIPGNAEFVRVGLVGLARLVEPRLAAWIDAEVSFVGTSVDRITPRLESAGLPAVKAAGWLDAAPVVTEPFRDWTLSGDFPAGRPRWETAGARFVDDVEPWERRKLWLLNGAHTILAAAGALRGLDTVAEAIADDECRAAVGAFWAEAASRLPAGIEHVDYRAALIERFANPRIVHRLAQIAADGSTKARVRLAAVAEESIDAGADATGSLAALGIWVASVLSGVRGPDSREADLVAAASSAAPVAAVLAIASERLAADAGSLEHVRAGAAAWTREPALATSADPTTT